MGVKKKWVYNKNHQKKVWVKIKVGVKKKLGGGERAKRNQFSNNAFCRCNCQYCTVANAHHLILRGCGFECRYLEIFEVEKIAGLGAFKASKAIF